MKLLDRNIFNNIKHRIPQDNYKNLSFINNKSIENVDASYFILKPKEKNVFYGLHIMKNNCVY